MPEHQQIHQSKKPDTIFQKPTTPVNQTPVSNPYSIIQRAKINPKSLSHADVMQLQRTIGNRAVAQLLSGIVNSSSVQQATVQRQEIPEEEEPLQGKFETIQLQEIPEEEEPLQGKMIETVQRQEIPDEEEPLQGKMFGTVQRQEIPQEEEPLQAKRENNTGMPDNLKAGTESLSGIDMSNVRVHYNSPKPAEVGALAYTQGTEIHVASGQERHLPHEAWHVVQQKQGRVQPTMQLKDGIPVNNDEGLEHEADVMGSKALQMKRTYRRKAGTAFQNKLGSHSVLPSIDVVQRINGAFVNNWHTRNITSSNGFITHTVGWGSSTGNLNELNDVLTREEVSWAAACPWALEPQYQAPGQHHGIGVSPGNLGSSQDNHQATQPYLNPQNPPASGLTQLFVMTQLYQYSTDNGTTWHDIPNSNYILRRSLYRRKWPFNNQYVYELTKSGISDPINHTTKITVKL